MSPRVGVGCSGGVQRQQLPRGSWRAWRTDREESARGCLTANTTYYYSLRDINCRQQRHRNSTEGNAPSNVPEAPKCVRWMELCVFHREGEKADNFWENADNLLKSIWDADTLCPVEPYRMPHKCDTLFPMTTRPGSTGAAGRPAVCREEEEGEKRTKQGRGKGERRPRSRPQWKRRMGKRKGAALRRRPSMKGEGNGNRKGPREKRRKGVGGHVYRYRNRWAHAASHAASSRPAVLVCGWSTRKKCTHSNTPRSARCACAPHLAAASVCAASVGASALSFSPRHFII